MEMDELEITECLDCPFNHDWNCQHPAVRGRAIDTTLDAPPDWCRIQKAPLLIKPKHMVVRAVAGKDSFGRSG